MVPVPVTLGPGESIDTHFVGGLSLKRRQVPKKYRKSTAVPVPVTGLGPGVSIDTHIVGALSLKKRKNEKNGFSKKPDFPDPVADSAIPVHPGMSLRSQEVHRSEKSQKKISGKKRISRIGCASMFLRMGPQELPVAKISDL